MKCKKMRWLTQINKFRKEVVKPKVRTALKVLSKRLGVRSDFYYAKEAVRSHIHDVHGNTVAYGLFEGMQLSENVWWGKYDVPLKILGAYEAQVLKKMAEFAQHSSTFIDIGAADGYYAVGALKSGLFEQSICFEISEKGREALLENAKINGVSDKLTIFEEADQNSLASLSKQSTDGFVLCDIEGAEFSLFNHQVFKELRNMHLIIELHCMFFENGEHLKEELISAAEEFFVIELMRSANAPVGEFDELSHFKDDYRYLAFSESRDTAGEWLVLKPKRTLET